MAADGGRQAKTERAEDASPQRDQGWIGLFRRFPIGVRIFLVVIINIVGLVIVAFFIAKGAAGVDAAGVELQQVRRIERIFNDIDAETGRIQGLIQRYFSSPNDKLLDEIESRKDILFQRIVDAYPYDDDISEEIRKAGETTRRLISGFQSLRVFNERIQDIYQKEFGGAIGGVQVRLSELSRVLSQSQQGAELIAFGIEQVSGAHLDANTYYHARRRDMLDLSREKLLAMTKRLDSFRAAAVTPDEKTSVEGLEAGLSGALDALGKLTEAFDQQSLYMKASIDGNQAALAAGMERVVARIRAREMAAHQRLDGALAGMRQRVVVVGLIFVGASILASFAIAASIGRPIGELRATMLAIVAGDYERIIRGVHAIDEIGAMARAVEVFRENIIARRQAELDRQAQERRWRSLLETSPIGISVLSAETGTRLYENQKYRALFGLSLEPTARVRERAFHENFVSPQDAVRLSEAVRKFGAVSGWEVRMRRSEGGQAWWCLMEVRPIEFEGRPAHIFWSYDVTDRRRAEDELRAAKEAAEQALAELEEAQENLIEAEKLAAIGGLVAGVAHEVNNPVGISLTVASSLGERAEIFAGELEAGQLRRSRLTEFLAATKEAASQLVSNLMRAADLVQSFKQVAVDRVHADRRAFDLKETIEQILSSLRPSLKSVQHKLVTEIEEGISMESYPGQLGQVITNLFMNALIHAFDDDQSGTITITGRRTSEDWVEITCTDTGRGMSEETRRRAFDPFFTTRRGQGGTGLGLHIVYNIVTIRLGGTISLETAPGDGARFVIELPVMAPDEQPDAEAKRAGTDKAGVDWGGPAKGAANV